MEKTNNVQMFSIAGAAAFLLGMIFPFVSISLGIMSIGISLLFDIGKLGEMNAIMYLISLLGLALVAYAAYVTFKTKKDFIKVAYAGAAYFVILLITYFILIKSGGSSSSSRDFSAMASEFIKLGFGTFMFLVGAVCYFLAERNNTTTSTDNEKVSE